MQRKVEEEVGISCNTWLTARIDKIIIVFQHPEKVDGKRCFCQRVGTTIECISCGVYPCSCDEFKLAESL